MPDPSPMSPAAIRHARARLGLSGAGLAALLGVSDATLERWEADPDARPDAAEAPPWTGLALRALVQGFQPPPIPGNWAGGTMAGGTIDGPAFAKLLRQAGLRQAEFARLIGTAPSTVRKWCASPGASTARTVNPVALRLALWALHGLDLRALAAG